MSDLIEHLARIANQARADFAEEWQDAEYTGERPDLEPITVEMRVEFAESLIDDYAALRARLEAVTEERNVQNDLRQIAEDAADELRARAERAEAALATARRDFMRWAEDERQACNSAGDRSGSVAYRRLYLKIRALANEAETSARGVPCPSR